MYCLFRSLIDTLDGMMMLWAYGWAMLHPARKLFFNLFLTVVSATIAILVAVVEVLGCVQVELNGTARYNGTLNTTFWNGIADINNNFEYIGYSIMAFFAISTLTAVAWFKCKLGPQLDRELAATKAAEEAIQSAKEEAAAAGRTQQDSYIRSAMLQLAIGNSRTATQQPRLNERAVTTAAEGCSVSGSGADGGGIVLATSGLMVSMPSEKGASPPTLAADAATLAQRAKERAYIRDHMLRAARGGN